MVRSLFKELKGRAPGPRGREALTFVMTVWPSCEATKSFTLDGGAFSSRFPPMKWSAILCLSA